MKEDDITVAVRSLNAAFQTGFDLIEQCLAVDSMEHGVLKAVQAKMDLELTKLWKLTVLKNITPSVNSSNRQEETTAIDGQCLNGKRVGGGYVISCKCTSCVAARSKEKP